ncbi:MAG: hypothetical protein IJ332_02705 [Clostridia bacterium]|nr:hypothetical protein [Clostridia bacterium]
MHNGVGVKFGKPTKRKGSKFPIIMVIIIIILALLAGIYYVHGIFYNKDNAKPQESTKTEQAQPAQDTPTVEPTVTEPKPVEEPAEEPVEEPIEETEEYDEEDTSTDNEDEESAEPESSETGNEIVPPDDTVKNLDAVQ